MKRKNFIAKACFFILVFLVSIISCEVGLGSAVDTEAPKLSIESPTVDSVIRDKFAIKGTWSDDGSIDSIVAELKRTDGYGTTIKLEGTNTVNETIEGKSGTWEVIVDYKEADLKDGTYQATVTIKDKGKHETSQNTTFTIDNTPPVLILTKPNSKPTDETLSVYGQRLFLEGSIADTTKETFIEVYFYKDEACTELLNTIKTQAIVPTDVNSNNGKLATFLDINYDKIYETEGLEKDDPARKHGAQPVFTKFKVYDSAIRIPVEGEKTKEDDEGNYTEYFYVSKDLSSKITLSKSSGGYGLAPIDLYNILNGSDSLKSNVRSATDIAAILTSLDSVKNSTSKFSINPDNSPYFTVSGLKTLTKSGSDFEEAANGYYVKNGTITLEVSVFMGSDSIELVDDDDFYVYLQECDDYGNPIESKPKIKLYSKYKEVQQQGQLKKTYYKIGGKEGHKTTTGAYVFSIPMNKTLKFDPDAGDAGIVSIDGLNYGSNYVLIVNGKDAEGNPVVPYDNGYGFKFSSSGNGPVLTVESPSFITTNTNNLSVDAIKTPLKVELLIDTTESSLEIKRGEADLSDPSWDNAVAIQNENGVSQGPITNFTPPATVQAFDYYPVPSTVQDGQTYKLMYFVYDGVNEEPSTKKITYTVDNTPPVIGGITIEGSAYDTNKWYQKNTLALVVNVTDAGSKVYKVEYKTDELADWTALTKDGEYFKGTITFLENGSRTLYLRATDNVGNISSETSKTIKIDTGKPDLEGYFYKINGDDINELDSIVYVNPSKTITVYGKYGNKNSGVKELSASIKGENDTEGSVPTDWSVKYSTTEITKKTITEETKDTITAELNTISTDAKTYENITDKTTIKSWVATFTPKAGNFKISGENNIQDATGLLAKTEKELFEIIADTIPPTFENIDLSDSYFYKSNTEEKYYYINNKKSDGTNKTFKFSGVAKDDYGLSSVSLKIGNVDLPVQRSAAWSFENLSFNDADGESVDCSITAVDKAGNESAPYEFTIVFDQSAPSAKHEIDGKEKDLYVRIGDDDNDDVEATDTIDKKVGKKYSNGSYGNDVTIQLRGNFDDGQNGSGVNMIYYKVYASEAAILNEIPDASDIKQLTPANLDTLKDKVIESPKAGKFAPLAEKETKRVFYNVKVTKATDDKTSIVAAEEAKGGTWFSDPKWTITDPLEEGYSTQVGYYKFYKNIETSFNTTITGLSEGNNFVVFVAQDNVGNAKVDYAVIPKPTESNPNATETYPCYSLNVDTAVPNITTNHEDDILFTNLEGNVVLSGTVSDADAGIRSLEFFIGNTALKEKNGDITVDTHNGNWTATIPGAKFSGSTTSTVYLLATDDAGKGNSTKSGVATVKIDKKGPNVLINSPVKDSIVNKTITLKGSFDDGNGAGVDITDANAPRLFWTTNETEAANKPNLESLKTKASEGWVELIVDDNNKSWDTTKLEGSFNVDTIQLKPDGDNVVLNDTTVYFTISATDISGTGNIDFAEAHSLVVDQNSDRPVIKFTNVDLNNMAADNAIWIKKQEIWGSVDDDDGEVDSVEISFDYEEKTAAGETPTWVSCYSAQDGLSYVFPDDGSKDGSQHIYFRVVDSEGTTFVSSVRTNTQKQDPNAPKLAYKTNIFGTEDNKYSTVLYSKIDLQEPTIPWVYYTAGDCSGITNLADFIDSENPNKPKDSETIKWKELANLSSAIGGETKDIYILVKAQDKNGIDSIKTTFDNELTAIKTLNSDTEKMTLYKIQLSKISGTEKKNLLVETTDNATHKHNSPFTITIDNSSPHIDIDSPAPNTELYGTPGVAANSVTVRGRSDDESGVKKIYMAVTKGGTDKPAKPADSAYIDITKKSALSWNVIFNGAQTNSEDVYYADLFNTYIDNLYGSGTANSVDQKDLCVWIYGEDELGNTGKDTPASIELTILTQGDKPIVTITYPAEGDTVGGAITITGSTSIATNSVKDIYLQIDPDYNGTIFNENWKNILQEEILDVAEGNSLTLDYEIKSSETTPSIFGIKANGSKQSWNVLVNAASEFNKANGDNRNIAVRAYAISESGKISEPVISSFILDPESPVYSTDFTLVQYSDNVNGEGSVVARKLYEPSMWIQGKWWFQGHVQDESGIDYIRIDNAPLKAAYQTLVETPYKGYSFSIPVGIGGENEDVYGPEFTLLAKESDGSKTSPKTIKLFYDNTPPEFTSTSLKDNKNNEIVQSDGVYEIKGTFFESGVQSGFKRIAFYVTRTLSGKNYITDIMTAQGSGSDNCYELKASPDSGDLKLSDDIYWKSITGCSAANGTEITVPSGSVVPAYARVGSLCRVNNIIYSIKNITRTENQPTKIIVDSKLDNGTGLTVDFALAQVIDIDFSEIGITTTYGDADNDIINDDGDWMVESYKETSGEWKVAINSTNIKDGTIQIHFVAYDQAGNKTTKSYNGLVANNAPRIAGIKFGSDTNGNGIVDDSELKKEFTGLYVKGKNNVTVNGQTAGGIKISKLALPNNGTDITQIDDDLHSVMSVKGKLTVIPEVVGGNNGLSWTYSVNDENKSDITKVRNKTENVLISGTSGHSGDNSIRPSNTTTISLDTLTLLKNIPEASEDENGNAVLGFTIWDHTEGTEPGYNSNKAEVLLKVNIALRDSTAPTAGIKPFYWDSKPVGTENMSSIVYNNSTAFGHIELEKDLPEGIFTYKSGNPETFTTGLYDLDPKVSGLIYLEGFAKDNGAVERLYLKFPGLAGFDDFNLVAHRDRDEDSETKGKLLTDPTLTANGVELVSADEKTVTEGDIDYNVVYWKLKIDTSRITTTAATDVLVQIKAEDRGKATLINSGTDYNYQDSKLSSVPTTFVLAKNQTGYALDSSNGEVVVENGRPTYNKDNQTPSYRMDIVPYIAGLKTSLSYLKKGNSSVYDRTALGYYSVSSVDTIQLYGFNLNGAKLYDKDNKVSSVLVEKIPDTSYKWYISSFAYPKVYELKYDTSESLTGISTFASGFAYVKVGDVKSLNNENNNDAKGNYAGTTDSSTGDKDVYSNYYNRQPNGENNNHLTDDIYLAIWQINSQAGKPKSGPLSQPVMAINPVGKQVGFAFASGPLHYSMGSLGKSYEVWEQGLDFWTSIGFAYDANGNSFGTTAGGDINGDPSADAFGIFTSRWGKGLTNNKGGHNNGTGQLRLELLGQAEATNGSDWHGNNINKQRIKSSSIATTVANSTATSTNVYLAYYDEINDEIRFKWGIISNGNNTTERSQNNLLYDYYGPKDGDGAKDSSTNTISLTQKKKVIELPYTLEYVSLIAGQTTEKWTRIKTGIDTWGDSYKADTAVKTREGNSVYAGQYVSIAAKYQGGDTYNIGTEEEPNMFTDDLVVAVWYDATNNQMLYSYNKTPQKITAPTFKGNNTYRKNADGSSTGIDSFSQSATGWSTPVAVFGEGNGIGEYCKVALDAQGKVHIACYDNSNADVWYAYISDATNPSTTNTKTCIVDSYGIVGTELYLDVALKDGNPIPYISYYGSSCARPKVAYWTSDDSIATITSREGAVDEVFTKNWEVSVIPSNSKISIDHINIGVWKDSSGNLTYSTKNGNAPSAGGTIGSSSAGNDNGMIYGNGSMNPILGYAITQGAGGYIETAQMK